MLDRLDPVTGSQVAAAYLRCACALPRADGRRALRVLVTGDACADVRRDAGADVVVVVQGQGRQEFPADLRGDPIRLRAPITPLSMRMALDHALRRWMDRVAAPPDPKRADQASERLVADSRPSRPASMSKVTA